MPLSAEDHVIEPAAVRADGQTALVTGAAVGIGRAVALTLARFGARVGVCDRDESGLDAVVAEIQAAGGAAASAVFDARDGDATRAFVAGVTAELGAPSILVNNVGGGFAAEFSDVSAKGQDVLVAQNFGSVTDCIRAFVDVAPSGASIVNITSIEAHRAAPGYAIYAAMKAAVTSLTRTLALEFADRGIRVNAIAPDMILTPGIGEDLPASTPLGIDGLPRDVAGAVIYLVSGLARFVTGTTLHVDGGNLAASGWTRRPDGSWTPSAGEPG